MRKIKEKDLKKALAKARAEVMSWRADDGGLTWAASDALQELNFFETCLKKEQASEFTSLDETETGEMVLFYLFSVLGAEEINLKNLTYR